MTLLELIKKQCKEQGVPEKYAERILKLSGITEDKDGSVLNAVTSFKENVYVDIQEAESLAEKARLKAVEEYEKKHNIKDGASLKTDDEPKDDDSKNDIDLTGMDEKTRAVLEAQQKAIADLTGLVTSMATNQKNSSTLEVVKSRLIGKIDDKFIDKYSKRVNLGAENMDEEIERISTEFVEDKQAFLNEAVEKGGYQPVSGGISDKDFDDYARRQSAGESEFEGVKI